MASSDVGNEASNEEKRRARIRWGYISLYKEIEKLKGFG